MDATKRSFRNIKTQLTIATSTLLGTISPVTTFAKGPDLDIQATSVYYYEEEGIDVKENIISVKKEIDDEVFLSGSYIVDVMSGPSPTGAATLDQVQTLTTPSGSGIDIPAGERPRFEFEDTRHAVLLNLTKPMTNVFKTRFGVSYSTEQDYDSTGFSTVFLYDTNRRHTTYETGLSANYDKISPVAGTPGELTSTQTATTSDEKNKYKVDGLFGVTQIINRHSLLQANLTLSHSIGYHTDPYKMFSLLDSELEPVPVHSYFSEKRPDTRNTAIIYLKHIVDLSGNTLNSSYRFFKDDWGINSFTLDAKFTYEFNSKQHIQFHGRYYIQSRAKFYHPYIATGYGNDIEDRDVVLINASNTDSLGNSIDYVSSDSRLSNFDSYTFGLKYSMRFAVLDSKLDLRLDHMRQYERKTRKSLLRAWVAQIAIEFFY